MIICYIVFSCNFFLTEGNCLHRLTLRFSCATWDTIPCYIWDSHSFFDGQIPNDSRRKCPSTRPSKCLTINREGSVMWPKLFFKPCPLFYREHKFQKMWLPKHLLGSQLRLAGVLTSPVAAKSARCGGANGWLPELERIRTEARVRGFAKRSGAGEERMPSSLRNHLHMSICFVSAVWFIPFQRAN